MRLGGTLTGRLTNVTFRHAIINPRTGVTTLANDSCSTRITNATFAGTLRDENM
jgi:hypothetical protein